MWCKDWLLDQIICIAHGDSSFSFKPSIKWTFSSTKWHKVGRLATEYACINQAKHPCTRMKSTFHELLVSLSLSGFSKSFSIPAGHRGRDRGRQSHWRETKDHALAGQRRRIDSEERLCVCGDVRSRQMLRKTLGSSAGAPKSIDISPPPTPNRSDQRPPHHRSHHHVLLFLFLFLFLRLLSSR
jgi:hypothetical protein